MGGLGSLGPVPVGSLGVLEGAGVRGRGEGLGGGGRGCGWGGFGARAEGRCGDGAGAGDGGEEAPGAAAAEHDGLCVLCGLKAVMMMMEIFVANGPGVNQV